MAILLVIVMMVFLPVEKHHDSASSAARGHRAYGEDTVAVSKQDMTTNANDSAVDTAISDMKGAETTTSAPVPPVAAPAGVSLSESEIFDAKCSRIAKLYQLSPREAEILPYLARGRNNAYLQEKFVISPHTAKSHIYNIYRKLDIHSQQRLMDFVEDFPDDYDIQRLL